MQYANIARDDHVAVEWLAARNSAVLRISSKNHSGKGRKSEKLPKDLETFVQAEFLIASHHRDLFRQSLGDDLTVEGICVQERQIEKRECMVRSVRQYAKVQVLKCAARVRCRKF